MEHKVKKVFIAGGTGFLGYKCAKLFLKMGVQVDTIALPNELETLGWFDKKIGLIFGDLFKMSGEELYKILDGKGYDTFVYALGPDDRVTPNAPAYDFFYTRLVTECKKICAAAKRAGIRRCVILNSYFTHFDEVYKGKLSKHHPYIKARTEQVRELVAFGKAGKFDVMIMMIPYVFGVADARKPIWRDSFLSHFENYNTVFFPRGGGTAVTDAEDIAEAVVAASYNGRHGGKYLIGNANMTYKELVTAMLKFSKSDKKYKELTAFICALGARGITRKNKTAGKESGLDAVKLMTQIQNKKFYIDAAATARELGYIELGFTRTHDVTKSIEDTMKACYPERF